MPQEGIIEVNHYTFKEAAEISYRQIEITLHLEHHRGDRVCCSPGWKAELQVAISHEDNIKHLLVVSHDSKNSIRAIRHWLMQFDDINVLTLLELTSMTLVSSARSLAEQYAFPDRKILKAMLRLDDELVKLEGIPDLPDSA